MAFDDNNTPTARGHTQERQAAADRGADGFGEGTPLPEAGYTVTKASDTKLKLVGERVPTSNERLGLILSDLSAVR